MINKNEQLPANNQYKITITSKYLSHFGCRFGLYQKMVHTFGRVYFKLTFNETVVSRQPFFSAIPTLFALST